jgi:IS30 family transposase
LKLFWDRENEKDALALIYWLCEDSTDRRIIDGRVEGLSFAAVARRLGVHPKTVRRRLLRIEVEFWRVRRGTSVHQVRRRA